MRTPIRLIVDAEPHSGEWNMALDAALLSSAVESRMATLRWYRWSEPTVSLGYFQDPSQSEMGIASLPTVRRLSGGGAIVHDQEITYSLALPRAHPRAAHPVELYDLVHGALVGVLRSLGVPAELRGSNRASTEFLCFGRADRHDVIVGTHKVAGSAQRRRRGAVLQHGSIVLTRSRYAPQFPGLWDLCPTENSPELSHLLSKPIADALGGQISPCELTDKERRHVREAVGNRLPTGIRDGNRRMI